jgi:hypothetical protein
MNFFCSLLILFNSSDEPKKLPFTGRPFQIFLELGFNAGYFCLFIFLLSPAGSPSLVQAVHS